jgi:hypothetical protein
MKKQLLAPKNQGKLVEIQACSECPFYDFDNQEDPAKWGKAWCEKLNAEIDKQPGDKGFPVECPL